MDNGDIVVLIPGITGSILQKDGRDVFGLTVGAGLRGLFSAGGSVRGLALADDPATVDDLEDGVTASALAPDAHLIPGLWRIDRYDKISQRLRRQQPPHRGRGLLRVPLRLAQDSRVAARRLKRQADSWLQARRLDWPQARLILVAHSMGGLVARYFLEVFDGWRDTRMLVTFGTPFRGSLNALDFLGSGFRKLAAWSISRMCCARSHRSTSFSRYTHASVSATVL
jgi:hypothetical protein